MSELDPNTELCARCGYDYSGHIGNTGVLYPCWTPSGRYGPQLKPEKISTPALGSQPALNPERALLERTADFIERWGLHAATTGWKSWANVSRSKMTDALKRAYAVDHVSRSHVLEEAAKVVDKAAKEAHAEAAKDKAAGFGESGMWLYNFAVNLERLAFEIRALQSSPKESAI